MDALSRLESSPPAPPELRLELPALTHPEVVRRWVAAMGLRTGNAAGPVLSALVPVVRRWAEEQGLTAPEHRWLGRALKAAGLHRRVDYGGKRYVKLLLHPDDAALLKRLCREAWAPARPPGDPVSVWKPRHMPRKLPKALFHVELQRLKLAHGRTTPLMDSTGRVWPSPAHAAATLGSTSERIRSRLSGTGHAWATKPIEGVLLRRLTPPEAQAVPEDTPVGARVGAGLRLCTCQHDGPR